MAVVQDGARFSQEAMKTAQRVGALEHLMKAVEFTRDIFGVDPTVSVAEDPELPDWTHLVLEVAVTGSVEDAARKNSHWHRAIGDAVSGSSDLFCLSIDLRNDR